MGFGVEIFGRFPAGRGGVYPELVEGALAFFIQRKAT